MKKTFAILSILFATTFASSDMSGFSEPIVKQPQRLASSAKDSDEYPGTEQLSHNPYSGKIKDFDWEALRIIPDITESSKHKYGFDGLPKECYIKNAPGYCFERLPKECYEDKPPKKCEKLKEEHSKIPFVYLSVEKGKTAIFNIDAEGKNSSKLPYDELYLLHEKEYIDVDKGILKTIHHCNEARSEAKKNKEKPISGKIERSINIKKIQDGGIYTICAGRHIDKDIKDGKPPTFQPIISINIIPYEMDPEFKKFIYIQLDGGEKKIGTKKEKFPNAFTKDLVDTYVNNVLKQAVVKAKSTDGNEKMKAGKLSSQNKLIEITMTNSAKTLNDFKDSKIYDDIYTFFKIPSAPDKSDIKSDNWHTIIAINKVRKKWPIGDCMKKDEKEPLFGCQNYYHFNPELENENTEYHIKSEEGCRKDKGTKEWDVAITAITEIDPVSKKKIIKSYRVFDKKNKSKPEPLLDCDTLFTDNGYPLLPFPQSIDQRLYALSSKLGVEDPKNMHKAYLPYGSLIFVPRGIGESGYYVLVHELGHSYGLTDVKKSYQTLTTSEDYDSKKKDWPAYINTYATKETNLMNWEDPAGKKIRFRDIPIAYTGGKETVLKIRQDEKNNVCAIEDKRESCKVKNIDIGIQEDLIKGEGEKQWECLRNCYKEDPDLDPVNQNRKKYWAKSYASSSADIKKEIIDVEEIIKSAKKSSDIATAIKKLRWEENFSLKILKNYFKIEELKNHFTIDELATEYTPEDLIKKCGYKLEDIESFYEFDALEDYY